MSSGELELGPAPDNCWGRNELPPIGTGKVFADLVDWLRSDLPEQVGELTTNMRQRVNQLTDQGTGILDLASLFIRADLPK